ncbi:hypothetical protein HK097_009938 [Rhizophlyctis rosea]|uniref:Uncharacterized protein n=1 Tax=Rhizophlyctis rosea TaxID=64517 RepID=A0AAD5SN68_9FUNG|nr:hypothetical protein HK097_009938 [Rhizophlyctis rosea]
MTVFYVGCLMNKEEVQTSDAKPIFKVMFHFSAGFSCEELKVFCSNLAQHRVRLSDEPGLQKLQYIHQIRTSVSPDYLFARPQALELKGGSFTRDSHNRHWVLRAPRLVRQCGTDRDWRDCVSFQELQEMGERSLRPLDIPGSVQELERLVTGANAKHVVAGRATASRRERKVLWGTGLSDLRDKSPCTDGQNSDVGMDLIGQMVADQENRDLSQESYQTTTDGSCLSVEYGNGFYGSGDGRRKRKRGDSVEFTGLRASAVQSHETGSYSTTTSTIPVAASVGEATVCNFNLLQRPPLLLTSSSGMMGTSPAEGIALSAPFSPQVGANNAFANAGTHRPPVGLAYDRELTLPDTKPLCGMKEVNSFMRPLGDDVEDVLFRAPDLMKHADFLTTGDANLESSVDCELVADVELVGDESQGSWDDVESVDLGVGHESYEEDRRIHLKSERREEMLSAHKNGISMRNYPAPTGHMDADTHVEDAGKCAGCGEQGKDESSADWGPWTGVDAVPSSPSLAPGLPAENSKGPSPSLLQYVALPLIETCNVFVAKCHKLFSPLRRLARSKNMQILHGLDAVIEAAGWWGGSEGYGWRCGMVVVANGEETDDLRATSKFLEEELSSR